MARLWISSSDWWQGYLFHTFAESLVLALRPFTSGNLGGMYTPMVALIKELEIENSRLKRMYPVERLKAEILNEAITKTVMAISRTCDDQASGA
jgi:hypothetical protein